MSAIREGDNLVVDGTVEHGVYPTRHEEIDQSVVLQGSYAVLGGIYGRRLRSNGSGTVHGPVVTREDLVLDETQRQTHEFLSGLTCPGIIRNEVPAYRVSESAVASLASARLRVRGPILADTVHLSNALVIGNIHARRVTLEACVVFGIIECDELLVMDTCNFVAYRAGRARLKGRLTTWLGHGVSYDGDEFLSDPSKANMEAGNAGGEDVPPDIRFLPVCLSRTACDKREDFDTCDWYHGGTCPSAVSGLGRFPNSPKVSLMDLDFQMRVVRRPSAADHGPESDPPLRIRYKAQEQERTEEARLSRLLELLTGGAALSEIQISTPETGWVECWKHPLFSQRYAISRVLSVTRRLLDGRAIEKSLEDIRRLAHRIAHYPHMDPVSAALVEKEAVAARSELFTFGIAKPDIRLSNQS